MPGWYVHLEAAALTAERMRAADLPVTFGGDPAEIVELGHICHRWRNYLEVGAIGPDLFFMLPDFAAAKGVVIRRVIQWTMSVWRELDDNFVSKWSKWVGPISDNTSAIIAQIDGGVLNMLGQALDNLAAAAVAAVEGLLTDMGDWFGILTSGVPQGYADSAFYWSDMFHYRRTYQVPFLLYTQALDAYRSTTGAQREDAEARLAFAVGWMSHCATDVAGHPFTNAKCGGPYRDHWQRHHLIENHMDAQNYTSRHPGPLYDDYGVSALHFRVAFCAQRAGYPGRTDAPAYDFTQPLPSYPTGHSAHETAERDEFFNLKSQKFPRHLADAIRQVMRDVYGDDGPKILAADPPFSAVGPDGKPDGRPNNAAFDEMWQIVYGYLSMSASDGLSPYPPTPPPLFNDHSFPQPPGGDYGVNDDPNRGADVDDSDFTLLDLLLAIVAWAVYLLQVALWIATVLPSLINDVGTFPLRLVLYYAFVVPLWNLYLLTRRALVMTGFLMPNRNEVDLGLTTMGQKPGRADSFIADLDAASGFASSPASSITEPSGRASAIAEFGLDGGYPRNIVRDHVDAIDAIDLPGVFGLTGPLRYASDAAGDDYVADEWLKPWNYPLRTPGGIRVPREDAPAHVGPFVVGETSTVLLHRRPGDPGALDAFEAATTPAQTAEAAHAHLRANRHMGAPVDYGVYLVTKFVDAQGDSAAPIPDFNLDADRGYAWHAWDWNRHVARDGWVCEPKAIPGAAFRYAQPCTPPQFFHADSDNPAQLSGGQAPPWQWFDPGRDLAVHYIDGEPGTCGVESPTPEGVEWPEVDAWTLWREQHDG